MEQTISKNEKGSGYATAGLVLGIVSLITWILPLLGYPVSIVGIVMASNGLRSGRLGVGAQYCGTCGHHLFLYFRGALLDQFALRAVVLVYNRDRLL